VHCEAKRGGAQRGCVWRIRGWNGGEPKNDGAASREMGKVVELRNVRANVAARYQIEKTIESTESIKNRKRIDETSSRCPKRPRRKRAEKKSEKNPETNQVRRSDSSEPSKMEIKSRKNQVESDIIESRRVER